MTLLTDSTDTTGNTNQFPKSIQGAQTETGPDTSSREPVSYQYLPGLPCIFLRLSFLGYHLL